MSDSLFDTGIRPLVDAYLKKKGEEKRDYGKFWSASSAGYCMRKLIMERLGVPRVSEIDARTTRVFESGHVFHEWLQRITKDAGISIAQELELQDENLMIRGHIDDLVLVGESYKTLDPTTIKPFKLGVEVLQPVLAEEITPRHLILYDYKTVNSRSFMWAKKNGNAMSHFHKMQLGTYMYMLRKDPHFSWAGEKELGSRPEWLKLSDLSEARILKIEKDALMMGEQQLMWTPALEKEVYGFWSTLNGYWKNKKLPKCTCGDYEGGFMAKPAYNPFYYKEEPCSLEWYKLWKEKQDASA